MSENLRPVKETFKPQEIFAGFINELICIYILIILKTNFDNIIIELLFKDKDDPHGFNDKKKIQRNLKWLIDRDLISDGDFRELVKYKNFLKLIESIDLQPEEGEYNLYTISSENLKLLIDIGLNTGNLSKFLQVEGFVDLVRSANPENLELLIGIGFIKIDNLENLIKNIDLLGLAGPAKSENLKLLLEGNEPILIKENLRELMKNENPGELMKNKYFLDLVESAKSENLELLIDNGFIKNKEDLLRFFKPNIFTFGSFVRSANPINLKLLIDNGIINIDNLSDLIQDTNFFNLVRSANSENLELLIGKGLSRDILLEFLKDEAFMTLIQSANPEDLEKLNKKLSDRINPQTP